MKSTPSSNPHCDRPSNVSTFSYKAGVDTLEGKESYPDLLHLVITNEDDALYIAQRLIDQVNLQKGIDNKYISIDLLGEIHSKSMTIVSTKD